MTLIAAGIICAVLIFIVRWFIERANYKALSEDCVRWQREQREKFSSGSVERSHGTCGSFAETRGQVEDGCLTTDGLAARSHPTTGVTPGPLVKSTSQNPPTRAEARLRCVDGADRASKFPNTESLHSGTSPAEASARDLRRGVSEATPEGPGTDGHKPLMRNRVGDDCPSAKGYAAGENFKPTNPNNIFPRGRWSVRGN